MTTATDLVPTVVEVLGCAEFEFKVIQGLDNGAILRTQSRWGEQILVVTTEPSAMAVLQPINPASESYLVLVSEDGYKMRVVEGDHTHNFRRRPTSDWEGVVEAGE